MTRKAAINREKLSELGLEKLAQLVLDQAGRDAAFRKRVSAALAAKKGPESVAKIIDRRLAALEKARSFVNWDKSRAFRDDLSATVATAAEDLGTAAPAMAVDRLLRFVATNESVFERVDYSSGRIEDVYFQAIENIGKLTPKLAPAEKAALPEKIMNSLDETSYGYMVDVASSVVEHLPDNVLRKWEDELSVLQAEKEARDAKSNERFVHSNAGAYRTVRQIIADARGDLDGIIALEATKHPNQQNAIGIAERLLEAGRNEEALDWVRRKQVNSLMVMSDADLADGLLPNRTFFSQRISLEAKILEELGKSEEAQSLRWSSFEETLSGEMLRDYLGALPDFEEFDVLDRAFSFVLSSEHRYSALVFFMEWPKLDLAAKKVLAHRGAWDGGRYDILVKVADILSNDHALAATILYRALLDNILTNGQSSAYANAARYLFKLDALSAPSDEGASDLEAFVRHETYRAEIQKKHGRKYSFWAQVKKLG